MNAKITFFDKNSHQSVQHLNQMKTTYALKIETTLRKIKPKTSTGEMIRKIKIPNTSTEGAERKRNLFSIHLKNTQNDTNSSNLRKNSLAGKTKHY